MGRGSIERPIHLSRKLLKIRQSLGLSQNEMITRLGLASKVTQAELSAFELGKRVPPLVVLLKYARTYGRPIDDLVDDEIEI